MFKIFKRDAGKESNFDYKAFWQKRYISGGNSGAGSYGVLAEYKAEIINDFINERNISSVIEFGCGDGNQLKLMKYKKYLGLDVAAKSIDVCSCAFKRDAAKSFALYDPKTFYNNGFIKADLVVCLDVLYHITDEDDFVKTLNDIFSCASKYVVLYTNIRKMNFEPNTHVFYRDTIAYLDKCSDFEIEKIVEQKYENLSGANFIFLKKKE